MTINLNGPDSELSDGDFRRFAGLVYAASGIHLTEQKRELLRARLRKRLRALGLHSYKEYFNLVTSQGADGELTDLLDVVSTNKTDFFREAQHFDHLRDQVLPAWRASNPQGTLRIWSAASSSGQEIYTLAMVLTEAGLENYKILGTDISTRMLDIALEGVYEERHLEGLLPGYRQKYFEPAGREGRRDEKLWAVRPELRSKVAFSRLNLIEAELPFQNPLDVIFCRNVMIYFDRPTQEALIEKMTQVLKVGGYLYTGLSESLLAVRHRLKTVASSVYQRQS